jgi:hypothetical protein
MVRCKVIAYRLDGCCQHGLSDCPSPLGSLQVDWTDAHEIDGVRQPASIRWMKPRKVPIIRQGVSERLHWIPMDSVQREKVYRRSGEKA